MQQGGVNVLSASSTTCGDVSAAPAVALRQIAQSVARR
jgi:hypothetical protein